MSGAQPKAKGMRITTSAEQTVRRTRGKALTRELGC
jgi:hypothetical protein